MKEGYRLDASLGNECFGSRLHKAVGDNKDVTSNLYRKYHELYGGWRDTDIRKAKQMLLEEKTSVCILGLDLKQYFYRIRLDFSQIAKFVGLEKEGAGSDQAPSDSVTLSKLLQCVRAVGAQYRRTIGPSLELTNPELTSDDIGLPIGLCSSPVLANWHLRPLDSQIMDRIRPANYGRYVDDLLLVVSSPNDPSREGDAVS
jgi:hypothetical protein